MEMNIILMTGAILLGCGAAGLFVVRLSTPTLQGLGWLAGAFGLGSLGALLLHSRGEISPLFSAAVADVLVLSAFVLLHLAFLELTDHALVLPRPGILLVCAQLSIELFCLHVSGAERVRLVSMGLLVALQVSETARILLKEQNAGLRAPTYFNAAILLAFGGVHLIRSLLVAVRGLAIPDLCRATEAMFILYIATALGIAFGFFWMTTGRLCSRLEHIASTDPLTRLYNRRIFLEWCERERLRSERSGKPFSLLMVDLDHFKQVNDSFGHSVGDATLCAVVERMQDAVRGIDVLGRWGGEEFVVLLPGATSQSALLVAQRLRANVERVELPFPTAGKRSPEGRRTMSVSVGLASYRGAQDRIGDILERADAALYKAKAAGRNQVLTIV